MIPENERSSVRIKGKLAEPLIIGERGKRAVKGIPKGERGK